MNDIKIPVSAPGATQAAKEMEQATQAARNLIAQHVANVKGTKDFADAAAREAQVLNTQVTPALKRAREEAAVYNAMMSKGMLAQGRSFLGGSSLSVGGGGHSSGILGDPHGHAASHIETALARMFGHEVGGPAGHLLGNFGRIAGVAGVALTSVAVVGIAAAVSVKRWLDAEKERLESIAEETKIRQDLNQSLKTAAQGQQDRAAGSYMSNRDAYRVIAGTGRDAYDARGRIAAINAEGDPEVIKAMAKFIKSRNGQMVSYDNGLKHALDMAHEISATGVMSTSEALTEMAGVKHGRGFSVDDIVAHARGRRRGSAGETQDLTDKVSAWSGLDGYDAADEYARQKGEAGLRDGTNMNLVLPSLARQLTTALDPVGEAASKFKSALLESLEPMRARAEAENQIIKAYSESTMFRVLFNSESESEKFSKKLRQLTNATR